MSRKTLDPHGRHRNLIVSFRVSREEGEMLNRAVALSGYTKQDYIISKVLNRDVVVRGSSRIYKALRDHLGDVLEELKRINSASEISPELMETIVLISNTMNGMKEESVCKLLK